MNSNQKLYIVTRSDLTPAQQACQAVHAALQFATEHEQWFDRWHTFSDHICLLAVEDEATLQKIINKANNLDMDYSKFVEPDINNSVTAVAIEPSDRGKKLCSGLKLMLPTLDSGLDTSA